MLYQLYEAQRTLMEPFVDFAQAAAKLYGNVQSPMGQNSFVQRVSAGYDLLYRLGKDYEKPEFGIHTVDVDGVAIAIHEKIEINKAFCELRRFKRFSDDTATLAKLKGQPAVLIVAPLSGHYATLLRDTVKTMLKDHKVYITDWKNARTVPLSDGAFHLDDYVNYVQEFIRHLQGLYGNCHVISVCQPTVPVFGAVSLMATRGELTPLSMTMMGGPIDARKSPTAVNNLAMNKPYSWFENNVIYRVPSSFPGAGRRVYPGFLQHSGFVAMNPDRHATSHYDYFQDLIKGDGASVEAHRKFYDEYNAVLDMDADYYLQTIETVFQKFKLVNGTWDVKNVKGKAERVRPSDIKTTAVMTIEGELDDISGCGQTKAALEMCSGVPETHKMHYEVKGAGHYGIFAGRRWRELVYPAIKAFILEAAREGAKSTQSSPAPRAPAKSLSATTTSVTPPSEVKKVSRAPAPSAKEMVRSRGATAAKKSEAVTAKVAVKTPAKATPQPARKESVAAVTQPAAKTAARPVPTPAARTVALKTKPPVGAPTKAGAVAPAQVKPALEVKAASSPATPTAVKLTAKQVDAAVASAMAASSAAATNAAAPVTPTPAEVTTTPEVAAVQPVVRAPENAAANPAGAKVASSRESADASAGKASTTAKVASKKPNGAQ